MEPSLANRWSPQGEPARLRWAMRLMALGFGVAIVLCFPLWGSGRPFPLLPLWEAWPSLPPSFDFVAPSLMLLACAAWLVGKWEEPAAWLLCALLLFLIPSDLSRLHPWVFQYFFMALAVGVLRPWREGGLRPGQVAWTFRLVIAGIYFWSGLHKANGDFIRVVWPWLLEPFPDGLEGLLNAAGFLIHLMEMFIGIGLLVVGLRPYAVGLAIAMHLLILSSIGPLGHNWNSSVWPWNLAMLGMVWVLFVGEKEGLPWSRLRAMPAILVGLLFWLLPALHLVDLWPAYLSASLYSGKAKTGVIYMPEALLAELPEAAQRRAEMEHGGRQEMVVYTDFWAMDAMNSPFFPEMIAFDQIMDEVCALPGAAANAPQMYVTTPMGAQPGLYLECK